MGFNSPLLSVLPNAYKVLLIILATITLPFVSTHSQSCPPNIDFENGTFDGWTCYAGGTASVNDANVISLGQLNGPAADRQTIYGPGSGLTDPYGGFPVNCPNGSGYSIKLGNNFGGGQAEGVSYEFTIPANQNTYSLIYHYAVVFQSPNHRQSEQPRMEIEVMNMTDNERIECASFTFIAQGSSLPGFITSSLVDSTAVLYKDWSAVTVDLSGNAGKTIRLFFKTTDCTFRRHFGYAYIDVDSECNGSFVGATYCPDDTLVNITAPFGYQSYTWFDSSQTTQLGTQQVLTLTPPPPSGTTLAVKLSPYDGFGCPKTLYATLNDTLTVVARAGTNILSCNQAKVQIGGPPRPGWKYTWLPGTHLSNASIANPLAFPLLTTAYVVKTTNAGGGCKIFDTVVVKASIIDTALKITGRAAWCFGKGDSAVLSVAPTTTIQWYKDNQRIPGANLPTLRANSTGVYVAQLSNSLGCTILTLQQSITIDTTKPGITYPLTYAIIDRPLQLTARPIGQKALWTPGANLSANNIFNPVYNGASERQYLITIITKGGCITVDTQLVRAIKNIEMYVPTAFSPNNDGLNDYLHPIVRGVKEIKYFRIYNRWGNLLHQSYEQLPGWDGILNGIAQQTQTVIWTMECVGLDDKLYQQKGTSLLLR